MFEKSRTLSKSRNKTIIAVAAFITVMVLASFLLASIISFVPLETTQNKNESDDKFNRSQYDISSLKIQDDNKVELIVKRDGLEYTPEMNQLFKEYDVEIHKEYTSINCIIVYVSLYSIENFILDAKSTLGIAYAEPNFYGKACFIPNDDAYGYYQYYPPLIGMETAWDYQLGSQDVLVAVIDTGIDYTHPDLIDNYVPLGYDWVNDDGDPWDDNGHGTHCAGIIAATINNDIGIAGMAQVSIFAEKVADVNGYSSHADFKAGVIHAVDMGADILSVSLAWDYDSSTMQEAIEYASDNDVMVIVPMGNEGGNVIKYPAYYYDVIAVGATDTNDERASFSNYGSWIDISAGGVDVMSTDPGILIPTYSFKSGTSMAVAHVAGLAALMMSECPSLTPDQTFLLIIMNAVDLGDYGPDDYYGFGGIDAHYMFPFNFPPNAPSTPSPSNGETVVVESPTLNVTVTDPNGDVMDVVFFNASDDTIIGTDIGIPSGGTASTTWEGLSDDTTYSWYAKAYDWLFSTPSSTWSFTTNFADNWTFLVYLDGDNEYEYAAIDAFNKMGEVGSDENINIVVQFDRIPGHDGYYDDWTTTKRFYITNGMEPYESNALPPDLGELNMGSPATLSDFITWGTTNYPADKYALILCDEGSGWNGSCYDDTDDEDLLTTEELEEALSIADVHIDLLGFDACYMAMAEVDYQIKDWADVRVGSEEFQLPNGWPYNTILTDLKNTPGMNPRYLGEIIVNKYMQSYPGATIETQSAVDLTLANTLASAIDNFAQLLIDDLDLYRTEIGDARVASGECVFKPYYIDLYDFAYEINNRIPNIPIQNAAQDVMNSISTMVIHEDHGTSHPDFHGISIYFPNTSELYDSNYESVLDFTAEHLWDEFLNAYFDIKDWTFLVYMAADNDLETAVIWEFDQMASVGSDANISIVAQIDRMDGDGLFDWTTTKRFYINKNDQPDSSTELEDLGELNMGSQDTLSDFITWGTTNYPADKYALILWGHGAGWEGICSDETSLNDSLSLEELEAALSVAGVDIDLLGFVSCYMAMTEVDYQIKDWADVCVGSQEKTDGYGWPFNTILTDLENTPDMNPRDLGEMIVDKYMQSHPVATTETQSAVDLSLADTLASAIDNFAQLLIDDLDLYRIEIGAARAASGETFERPDYIDLYDFAYEINNRISNIPIQNAAQDIMNSISTMVIHEDHGSNHPDFHGILIYFPSTFGEYDSAYESILDFTADLLWDEFLRVYFDDNYEENDDILSAYDLSSYEQTWLSSIDGLGVQADDDWYAIYITPGTVRLVVGLLFTHADGDINIAVYDSSGLFITASTSTSNYEYIDYTLPSPGIYYLLVYSLGDAGNNYDLWWDDTYNENIIIDPIHIDTTNPECDWEWAKTQEWCSGEGTEQNPYVIQDLIIDASDSGSGILAIEASGLGSGILIENSNAYFRIENCKIYNADMGIKLVNTYNGEIINNNCSKNKNGIYLEQSNNNIISGNTVNNNDYGIYLSYSSNNILSGNTANENTNGIYLESSNDNTILGNEANRNYNESVNIGVGIHLRYSDNNTISGNTASENNNGIFLKGSTNNTISGNIAYNNWAGIFLAFSSNNTVSKSFAHHNDFGIVIGYDSDDNIIWGNLINYTQAYGIYLIDPNCENNLIYQNSLIGTVGWHAKDSGKNTQWNTLGIGNYWDNHTSSDIDNDGIVDTPYTWIYGSAGSNDTYPLAESPHHNGEKIHIDDSGVRALNWSITAKLKLWCSGSGTEEDPYIINGLSIDAGGSGSGILIENSDVYFIIRDCTVYNAIVGIKLSNTINGIISGNIVRKNSIGICLWNSDNTTVSGNTASNNQFHGIFLQYGNNNTISGNTVHHNWIGIFLAYSNNNTVSGNILYFNWIGIVVQYSNNNTVSGNRMAYINGHGIWLIGSNNNIISENRVAVISEYGILLHYSSYNTGTGNIILNTGAGPYYEDNQCYDNNIGYS